MIHTCGQHPEEQSEVAAEQEAAEARGEQGPMLYFGPRSDCDFCQERTR